MFGPSEKRAKELEAFGKPRFTRNPNPAAFLESVKGFELIGHGGEHNVDTLLECTEGDQRWSVADYRYVVRDSDHGGHFHLTVCLLAWKKLQLPHFVMRRRIPFVDAVASKLGRPAVDFSGAKDFSKLFFVEGGPEVRDFFSERVRAGLIKLADRKLLIEGLGDRVTVNTGEATAIKALGRLLDDARAVGELLAGS